MAVLGAWFESQRHELLCKAYDEHMLVSWALLKAKSRPGLPLQERCRKNSISTLRGGQPPWQRRWRSLHSPCGAWPIETGGSLFQEGILVN